MLNMIVSPTYSHPSATCRCIQLPSPDGGTGVQMVFGSDCYLALACARVRVTYSHPSPLPRTHPLPLARPGRGNVTLHPMAPSQVRRREGTDIFGRRHLVQEFNV
jgi:hypothetical protein